MAIPTNRDSQLADWSTNADARLNASPASYGTTAAIASAYRAVHAPFIAALDAVVAAREAGTRSSSLCAIKSACRLSLLQFARPLYTQIQSNRAVSAAAKIELGIIVPDRRPGPIPPPAFAPRLTIVRIDGRLVRIRLSDPRHPTHKRMPSDVDGATIMSFVGAEAPTGLAAYKYEGGTSRTMMDILFPDSVLPGTQVWLTAFFFNRRKQDGLACTPVSAIINYGGTMAMAA